MARESMTRVVVLLALAAVGCSASRPYVQRPPPPYASPLPNGWQWPVMAQPAWNQPRAVSASGPVVPPSTGVVRPFDAKGLRASPSDQRGCRPIEIGPGEWYMPHCDPLPILGRSSLVAPRSSMGIRGNPPDAVDLRTQGFDGPVKDQQQVGVCWAFTVSTLMENAARRQSRSDVLSPLHIVANDVFTSLMRKGKTEPIAHETTWAYDPVKACKMQTRPDRYCTTAYHVEAGSGHDDPVLIGEHRNANQQGVVSVVKVERVDGTFDAIAGAIAEGQAVYVAFEIDDRAWGRARGGVIEDYSQTNRGSHAVAAMGYRIAGPRGRELLLHNSWGTRWGDRGYAWISENMLSHLVDSWTVQIAAKSAPSFDPTTPVGLPWPLPIPKPQQREPSSACAAGKVADPFLGVCVPACPSGRPGFAGVCLP